MKTPTEIRQMFDDAITGKADISIDDCIWALLADVINSINLAEGGNPGPIQSEVTDYLSNHYGD